MQRVNVSPLIICLGLSFLLWGAACKRRAPKPSPAETTPTAEVAPAKDANNTPGPASTPPSTAPRPAPTAAAPQDRATAESLRFLNDQLREFIAQQKRFPKSFKEFEGIKIDSPRRPPPGMQWALDEQSRSVVLTAK